MKKIFLFLRDVFSFAENKKRTRIVTLSSGYVPQIWFYDEITGIFRWACFFDNPVVPTFDPEDHWKYFKCKSLEGAEKLLQEMIISALVYAKEQEDMRGLRNG